MSTHPVNISFNSAPCFGSLLTVGHGCAASGGFVGRCSIQLSYGRNFELRANVCRAARAQVKTRQRKTLIWKP